MDIKPQEAIIDVVQFSALTSWVKEQGAKGSGYFSAVFDDEEYYANISAYLSQILSAISLKS
ncbi:hypothetical protein [uncultured Campylobacter sp.]|mgnify:CR=1 FL=1|uniref:hypothetical protein n=1 Tax=uncultured Campylobacter sp. TaxID=218934 RepID=UPI003211B85C